jgi:Cu+-exporting ATPase
LSDGVAKRTVELRIGGMTCASCAARIEKKLNRIDGVRASVNFATEKAWVSAPDEVSVDDLVATVEGDRLHRRTAPTRARDHHNHAGR